MIYLQDVSDKKLNSIIFALSINLIEHPDFQKKQFVIKYFDEVLRYKLSESYWKWSMKYISTLVILQFYIRMLSLKHYLSSKWQDWYIYDSKSISLIIFQDFHSLWLINEINCSFIYIYKLLNYKMSAFKDAIKENKL